MSDPAAHTNAPCERGPFIPQNEWEEEHAAVIREKMMAGLSRSQAILALQSQQAHDAGIRAPEASHEGNLGGPFEPVTAFEKEHESAIRERMRGGLTREQATQCVRDQLQEDARQAARKP